MLSIQLDETRFKECTRRLSQALKSRGVSINHQSLLQTLALTLVDKPYEEIKETLLQPAAPASADSANKHNSVMILNYGGQSILTVNFAYISATNEGTDLEIPYKVLEGMAHSQANSLGATFQIIELPMVLADDYSDDDVIELARKMGYGKPYPTIFECIELMVAVRINGKMFDNTGLDADNMSMLSEDDDPWGGIVWMPELRTIEGTYEHYFTFEELCNATSHDGRTWVIPESGRPNGTSCNAYFWFD